MTLEVKRTEKENPRRLVRRFSQKFRQTGITKKVRSYQFHQRPKSKLKKKLQALKKLEIQQKTKKDEKMGKSSFMQWKQ